MNLTEKKYAMNRIKEIRDGKISAVNKYVEKKQMTDAEKHSALKHKQARLLPFNPKKSSYVENFFEFPLQKQYDTEHKKAVEKQQKHLAAIRAEYQRIADLVHLGSMDNNKIMNEIKKFEQFCYA